MVKFYVVLIILIIIVAALLLYCYVHGASAIYTLAGGFFTAADGGYRGGTHNGSNNHTATATFSTDGKKFYDTVHVWELMKDAPVKNIAVADIEDSLDQPQWDGEISARDVLRDPEAYPEHTTRINNADLSFPILVVGDKIGNIIIADGMHRLAKAYRDGIHYVNIQHIPKKVLKAAIFNIND